jgi:hypothetical protein
VERINKNRVTVLTRKSDLEHAKQGKGDTGLVIFFVHYNRQKKSKEKKNLVAARNNTSGVCTWSARAWSLFHRFVRMCVLVIRWTWAGDCNDTDLTLEYDGPESV